MASVTWPPLVTAAPISSSVKVARARPGTAAAMRPMRVARMGGTGMAVVDIGRKRTRWRTIAPNRCDREPSPCPPTRPSSNASAAARLPGAGACWCASAPMATSLVARRSGVPLARLRLTGEGDDVVLLYPSHRGGWEPPGDFGAVAMPLDLALEHLQRQSVLPGTPSALLLSCGTHPTAQP